MALHGWIRRFLPTAKPRRRRSLASSRYTERLECKTLLSAFVVTTPLDLSDIALGDGVAAAANGQTSLRSAIQEANSLPGPDTVILPRGLFALPNGDSPGNNAIDDSPGTPLLVTDDLTIIGAGSTDTEIHGGSAASVFEVDDDAILRLGWLTVRNESGISVAIHSGQLVEIADTVVEPVARPAPTIENSDPQREQPGPSAVANLNANRLPSDTQTVNQRQSQLLALLFNRPTESQPTDALLIPVPPAVAPANPPLDATLGIPNPGSADGQAASGEAIHAPARIASSTEDSPPEPDSSPQQRREAIVNSLFQIDSESSTDEVKPAAAIEQTKESQAAPPETNPATDGNPTEPPLPFPELNTPPVETELPSIRGAAPLLPDLETELPEIRIDDTSDTPRRGALLPVAVGGLLAAAVRFRSSRRIEHDQRSGQLSMKWANRVDALI